MYEVYYNGEMEVMVEVRRSYGRETMGPFATWDEAVERAEEAIKEEVWNL